MINRDLNKPVFFGFMAAGFISLLGGIAMFIYVVPKDMEAGAIPRDVGVLFTGVFSEQILAFNESKRYAAALGQVGMSSDTCEKYSCRLTVTPDGANYIFRLSKDGHTWAIQPQSMVPKEIL